MELKHVIPNMEKTFGTLEFAGENKVEQRRINGRMTVVSRSFNLYSDVQRADDIIVVLPASAGEKNFESEEKVKLIKYFCSPCAPTKSNGGRTRNRPEDAPEKWSLFKSYNRRDVETEMGIQQKLTKFPVPEFVWDGGNGFSHDSALLMPENRHRHRCRNRIQPKPYRRGVHRHESSEGCSDRRQYRGCRCC